MAVKGVGHKRWHHRRAYWADGGAVGAVQVAVAVPNDKSVPGKIVANGFEGCACSQPEPSFAPCIGRVTATSALHLTEAGRPSFGFLPPLAVGVRGSGFVANIRFNVSLNLVSSFLGPSDMSTPPIPPIPKPPRDFFHAYGIAMAQWAYVELRLSQWFQELTGMAEDMARTIFFSARSFQGRSDMVDAAIAESIRLGKLPEATREVLELGVTRANGYSGYRNALAHGLVVGFEDETGKFASRIVQGKHRVSEHQFVGITFEQIEIAERNFLKLAQVLVRSLKAHQAGNQEQLLECLEQARLLPSEADSATLSQNQLGRERQRQAARRKAQKAKGREGSPPQPQ